MIKSCLDIEQKLINKITNYIDMCKVGRLEVPKLFMLQIGDVSESSNYVFRKELKCLESGVLSETMKIDRCTFNDMKNIIRMKNADNLVNGIMIQLPLDLDESQLEELLQTIDPDKDVDGFTLTNLGKLYTGSYINDKLTLLPCTAKGVMQILNYNDIEVKGKNVVVLGRGRTSGKPIAQMLINKGATVTVLNSHTQPLQKEIALNNADLVVSCVGKPNIVNRYDVQEHTHVINVGMTWKFNEELKRPQLLGDVNVPSFEDTPTMTHKGLVTTVSNSTGVLTVANLLYNTCLAHLKQNKDRLYPKEYKSLYYCLKGDIL